MNEVKRLTGFSSSLITSVVKKTNKQKKKTLSTETKRSKRARCVPVGSGDGIRETKW